MMPWIVQSSPHHDMPAFGTSFKLSCCHLCRSTCNRKADAISLPQDLYAHSERVSASCPVTEAAIIRSEVTLVNNSATAWKGHLRITVDHCQPLTSDGEVTKPCEQSVSATAYSLKHADQSASGQKQSTVPAAEHLTAEQRSESSKPSRQRNGIQIKAQHSVIERHRLTWTETVSIPPGSTTFSMRDQMLHSPQLWWPLNMGKQVYLATAMLSSSVQPIYQPCIELTPFSLHRDTVDYECSAMSLCIACKDTRMLVESMSLLWCLQNLYSLRVSLYLEGFGLSDESTERFGIRNVCSVEDPELAGHVFYINEERVGGL